MSQALFRMESTTPSTILRMALVYTTLTPFTSYISVKATTTRPMCRMRLFPKELFAKTLPAASIAQSCSFRFNPHETLQRKLNGTEDHQIDLAELAWPPKIDDGIRALWIASRALSVLHCFNILFVAISIVATTLHTSSPRRRSDCIRNLISTSATLTAVIGSGIAETMYGRAPDVIEKHGNVTRIGLGTDQGSKFMALT